MSEDRVGSQNTSFVEVEDRWTLDSRKPKPDASWSIVSFTNETTEDTVTAPVIDVMLEQHNEEQLESLLDAARWLERKRRGRMLARIVERASATEAEREALAERLEGVVF